MNMHYFQVLISLSPLITFKILLLRKHLCQALKIEKIVALRPLVVMAVVMIYFIKLRAPLYVCVTERLGVAPDTTTVANACAYASDYEEPACIKNLDILQAE